MAATHSLSNFENTLNKLTEFAPGIAFKKNDDFYWSPADKTVYYDPEKPFADWSLVHELCHGLLNHSGYESDFELLLLETAAWHKAKELSADFEINIDEKHIQDCLDTYRDWLHRRSTCPLCSMQGIQTNPVTYKCSNCLNSWSVSRARFCRPYRRLHSSRSLT